MSTFSNVVLALSTLFMMLATVALSVFTYFQWRVNSRMQQVSDVVAISVVPNNDGNIRLLNVGNSNVYIHRIEFTAVSQGSRMQERLHIYPRSRMIPANAGDSSYYWIGSPMGLRDGEEFLLKIYLTDEFENKWIAEGGGEAVNAVAVVADGKIQTSQKIHVWTYKITRIDWKF